MTDHDSIKQPDRSQTRPDCASQSESNLASVCPACGGPLIEIRAKLQCARCHTICETCCEGGRAVDEEQAR